jgi:hypothetical protein
MDIDSLLALETAVWQALVDGNPDADRELLADDFVGLYPTGYATRQDHVAAIVDGPSVRHFDLTDVRMLAVSDEAALLLYRAAYERAGGREAEAMYVSSLWCRRGDRWLNVFSQDTPDTGVDVV